MLLSYCTNVHPAEDLDGVIEQLGAYAAPARVAAGLDVLGIGLWMPAELAHRLDDSTEERARLKAALAAHHLQVHTLNAFPYGGFHDDVVKLDVYSPTWAEPERYAYTMACARVLADLLPPGVAGSISTLPLGWRTGWGAQEDAAATAALARLSGELRTLAQSAGRMVRLAIEPEPGCILDNVEDVVSWLEPRAGDDVPTAERIDPEHVGVCLDTCHLAVSFADRQAGTAETVERIVSAGLRVVKVQASAALHVDRPRSPEARRELERFAEPRYVHQVRELTPAGVDGRDDLPHALGLAAPDHAGDDSAPLPGDGPWRVHFHVPLHHELADPLAATTDVLRDAVAAVRSTPSGDEAHLDIETYTWAVLPDSTESLAHGIAAELRWARAELLGETVDHRGGDT
ncbi:metabolite traffic protein EboE [Demequina sp. NBRC 110053]|uniref:metabolite traffic protein EboE n=1 Tax=Demequina sp. NBRC 110053 TaxID=1570342 RepID=UPI00190EC8CB|nr:metabolite traffic protein EboE [Demequina sp. NBRC 110053]